MFQWYGDVCCVDWLARRFNRDTYGVFIRKRSSWVRSQMIMMENTNRPMLRSFIRSQEKQVKQVGDG